MTIKEFFNKIESFQKENGIVFNTYIYSKIDEVLSNALYNALRNENISIGETKPLLESFYDFLRKDMGISKYDIANMEIDNFHASVKKYTEVLKNFKNFLNLYYLEKKHYKQISFTIKNKNTLILYVKGSVLNHEKNIIEALNTIKEKLCIEISTPNDFKVFAPKDWYSYHFKISESEVNAVKELLQKVKEERKLYYESRIFIL